MLRQQQLRPELGAGVTADNPLTAFSKHKLWSEGPHRLPRIRMQCIERLAIDKLFTLCRLLQNQHTHPGCVSTLLRCLPRQCRSCASRRSRCLSLICTVVGLWIVWCHREVKLLYLLAKVLVRGDENYQVLWPVMLFQHMHTAICSLATVQSLSCMLAGCTSLNDGTCLSSLSALWILSFWPCHWYPKASTSPSVVSHPSRLAYGDRQSGHLHASLMQCN